MCWATSPCLYIPADSLGKVVIPGSRASSRIAVPSMLDRLRQHWARQAGRRLWPWLGGHLGRQGAGAVH